MLVDCLSVKLIVWFEPFIFMALFLRFVEAYSSASMDLVSRGEWTLEAPFISSSILLFFKVVCSSFSLSILSLASNALIEFIFLFIFCP